MPLSPTTLFPAACASPLLFHMRGMTDCAAQSFNDLVGENGEPLWTERARFIADEGIEPVFIGCASETLQNNLPFIRESMPSILAWMYRERFLVSTNCSSAADLCERMEALDPLGYGLPGIYRKSVKDYLAATFFGMSSTEPWDGREQARRSAPGLPDPATHREEFRDYLLRSAFITCESQSCGLVTKDDRGRHVLTLA